MLLFNFYSTLKHFSIFTKNTYIKKRESFYGIPVYKIMIVRSYCLTNFLIPDPSLLLTLTKYTPFDKLLTSMLEAFPFID